MNPELADGQQVRSAARTKSLLGPTCGLAAGFLQANLVVLPKEAAFDFLLFCQRNPKPCPLLDVTEPGSAHPNGVARNADLRSDLPRYRVFRDGELIDEPDDVNDIWRPDLVSFLIGCSFSFEEALIRAGLPVRHVEQNRNVPMYNTRLPCRPAGRFAGNTVVSMRPMTPRQAIEATQITSQFPKAHGAPVHLGDPTAIGVDLFQPDYGDMVSVEPGEIPVFWACGVTPQAVLMKSRPEFAITHSPGCMFVTDKKNDSVEI